MKFISATILLIALLAQQCDRFIVILNFELNRNFIASNLCENRSKPTSRCKGKCYLKKQLAKTDKEQNLPGSNSKKDKNEVLFVALQKNIITFFFAEETINIYSGQNHSFSPQLFNGAVFHPPQA